MVGREGTSGRTQAAGLVIEDGDWLLHELQVEKQGTKQTNHVLPANGEAERGGVLLLNVCQHVWAVQGTGPGTSQKAPQGMRSGVCLPRNKNSDHTGVHRVGHRYIRASILAVLQTLKRAHHGPQIRAHAEMETLHLDNAAAEAGRKGTQWVFSPKARSWRTGQAKICVRLARHSLAHTLSSAGDLDYHKVASR